MKNDIITRTYKVDETVLTLILGLRNLMQQPDLPLEYQKIISKALQEVKNMAGINEKNYIKNDIMKEEYQINIDFSA